MFGWPCDHFFPGARAFYSVDWEKSEYRPNRRGKQADSRTYAWDGDDQSGSPPGGLSAPE